jgi:acyl carrier protein
MKATVIDTVSTRFQVEVSDDQALRFATVGDIAAYLQAAIG